MEKIIAEYGFYIGWSFGLTAFLMLGEPVVIVLQRQAVLQRVRRLVRSREAGRGHG